MSPVFPYLFTMVRKSHFNVFACCFTSKLNIHALSSVDRSFLFTPNFTLLAPSHKINL